MILPTTPGPRRFLIVWFCMVAFMVLVTAFVYLASSSLAGSATERLVDELKRMPQIQMQLQQMLRQGASQEQVMEQLRSHAGKQADVMVAGMFLASLRATAIAFLATIALYIALVMRHLHRSDRMVLTGAMVILLIVDLGYVAQKYILPEDTASTFEKTGAILKLEQVAKPFRVTVLSRSGTYNMLVSSLFGLYGIECMDVPADSRPTPDRAAFFYSEALSPLRRWQYGNVRFVLAPKNTMESAMRQLGRSQLVLFHEFVEDGEPQAICEVPAALPRVFAVGSWVVKTNASNVLAFMDNSSNDPHMVAVVCDASVTARSTSNFTGTAVITNYVAERIEAKVDLSQDGLVVMATEPDPGWSVTVDGSVKKLVRCNLLHQGVFVSAGAHSIVFSFYANNWTNTLNDWAYRALPVLLAATALLFWLRRKSPVTGAK